MRRILLLLLLLTTVARAEPRRLDYRTSAMCGNDWFTTCTILESADGTVRWKVFHGFMQAPLVEEGTLPAAEWNLLLEAVREGPREEQPPPFLAMTLDQVTLTEGGKEMVRKSTDALSKAFHDTVAGKRFAYWREQRR